MAAPVTEARTDTDSSVLVTRSAYYQGRHALLSPLTADDVLALYPQAEVAAMLPSYRPWMTVGQHGLHQVVDRLRALGELDPAPELEALVLHRRSLTPLGFICLAAIDPLNAKAELAAAFFRGRGSRPALEAIHWVLEKCFVAMALHKLIFYTQPGNRAAEGVLQSLGASIEGCLREELAVPGGGRVDLNRHALFRSDWMAGAARRRLQKLVPLAATATTVFSTSLD